GTLSFLITGDEEGHATDGTKKVVEALINEGERIDHCLVGEPTSAARLGDMIKVGRRGSINAWITVHGRQGHVAYPDRASNPIRALTDLMARLQGRVLDEGFASFPPSNLEITTIDVGNGAMNIIPARATMRLNIRFNPLHTGESLANWISETCDEVSLAHNCRIEVDSRCSGEAFLTEPGPFIEVITQSVEASLGLRPEASTTGGTSDARFIRALCPVVEFGLVGQTMHQIDEAVRVEDLERLTDAYVHLIRAYFERFQYAS
ncbi:MAG: succinyl-diaminopimelate desuccinylase, partial [Asticcacaulis sp.]